MSISIHEIVNRSIEDVVDEFHENMETFEVEFDDGILKCNGCEIVISRYVFEYWKALPRQIPIRMSYCIAFKGVLTPHTPLDLCTLMYRDYLDMYEFTEWDIDDSHMNRVVYKDVINGLYNFCVVYLDGYVQGADSFDLIEIMNHPPIREANERIKTQAHDPTPEEIDKVHDIIESEILTSPALKHNSFAIALRCKAIKMVQMQMMVGPVGYCTDINSSLFPRPLRCGFYEGSAKLWEFAIESRNASIASLYNELIMPISQYANRRYQLICQPVRWVVRADCGTRMYKETLITTQKKLNSMEGLWRLDEVSGSLVPIKPSDKHLIGKLIKHRSSLYCEWSTSRSEVCAVCHGRVYRAVMKFSPDSQSNTKGNNVGHIAAITLGAQNSSTVLGRKHANSTSVASKMVLNIEQGVYLEVSENGKYLLFHNKMKPLNKLKVILYKDQVEKLHDVRAGIIDITSPSSISQIESFTIVDDTLDDGYNRLPIILGSKQRTGYLSVDALDYIREHGWVFDENQNLVVDLKGWDKHKPFFNVPQIEFSPPEFIEEITSFMLGPSKEGRKDNIEIRRLDSYKTPTAGVDALYEEIQGGNLDVHYSHLSIIVLALSAQDPINDDYRLPYPRHKGVIVTETPLVDNNSAGMSMAYEKQHKILSSPATYVLHKRRGHPLDTLLLSRVYGNVKKILPPLRNSDKR